MPVVTATSAANVLTATINLSSAQILALNATPVAIVAAPGTGFAAVPIHAFCSLTFVTAQYASAGSLRLKYGATVADTLTNCTAATLAAASSVGHDGNLGQGSVAVANVSNVALSLDASAAITTGAGTLKLTLVYFISPT